MPAAEVVQREEDAAVVPILDAEAEEEEDGMNRAEAEEEVDLNRAEEEEVAVAKEAAEEEEEAAGPNHPVPQQLYPTFSPVPFRPTFNSTSTASTAPISTVNPSIRVRDAPPCSIWGWVMGISPMKRVCWPERIISMEKGRSWKTTRMNGGGCCTFRIRWCFHVIHFLLI